MASLAPVQVSTALDTTNAPHTAPLPRKLAMAWLASVLLAPAGCLSSRLELAVSGIGNGTEIDSTGSWTAVQDDGWEARLQVPESGFTNTGTPYHQFETTWFGTLEGIGSTQAWLKWHQNPENHQTGGLGFHRGALTFYEIEGLDTDVYVEVTRIRFTGDRARRVEYEARFANRVPDVDESVAALYLGNMNPDVKVEGTARIYSRCDDDVGQAPAGAWTCGVGRGEQELPSGVEVPEGWLQGDCPAALVEGFADARSWSHEDGGGTVRFDTGATLACVVGGGTESEDFWKVALCGSEEEEVQDEDSCTWHVSRLMTPGSLPEMSGIWVGGVLQGDCEGRVGRYCNAFAGQNAMFVP